MGYYISVRGWLESEFEKVKDIRKSIAETIQKTYGLESKEYCSQSLQGWRYPEKTLNWTAYIFYGCDLRQYCLEFFEEQLRSAVIADKEVSGYFRIDSEDGEIKEEWIVGNGEIEKADRTEGR